MDNRLAGAPLKMSTVLRHEDVASTFWSKLVNSRLAFMEGKYGI